MGWREFNEYLNAEGVKVKPANRRRGVTDAVETVKVTGYAGLRQQLTVVKPVQQSDEVCGVVAEGLVQNPKMRLSLYINLQAHKMITAMGAFDLSRALKGSQSLLRLNLAGNIIGTEGALYLAEALMVNNALTSLDLARNGIGDDGAAHIAEALQVNSVLIDLVINDNEIHDRGAESVAEALEVNQTLFYLGIFNKSIGRAGHRRLIEALLTNTSLVEMTISAEIGLERQQLDKQLLENKKKRQQTFLDTLESNHKTSWSRSRIMFVGQGRAGKSATVRSLLGHDFEENLDSTVGAFVSESESTGKDVNWKSMKTKEAGEHASRFAARILFDKSRQPRKRKTKRKSNLPSLVWKSLPRMFTRTGMNNNNNFNDVPEVTEQNNNDLTGAPNVNPIVVVNNNEPQEVWEEEWFDDVVEEEDEVLVDEKDIFRQYNENLFFDAESLMLSLWDFGGQDVFYSMHHMFLTKSGVYVLVFDMRQILDENTTEEAVKYLQFWLNSIKLHAPHAPLLIAGTFLEDIEGNKDVMAVDNVLSEVVKTSFPQVVQNDDENLVLFPIDNKECSGILGLRTKIEQVVRKDKSVYQKVSMNWIRLLDQILAKRDKESYLTLAEVKAIAKDNFGIKGKGEVEVVLSLFHERGMIIHLNSTETLRNIIIIKPQWLIDALSSVIRDESLHALDEKEFENVGLKKDLELTFQDSLASYDFLNYVWGGDQVEFFIDLMKRTMLLSEWNYREEKYYLIPSLLKRKKEPQNELEGIRCVFDFSKTFLPNGVFQRLICLSIAHCSSFVKANDGAVVEEPDLYKNFGVIEFEPGSKLHFYEDTVLQQIVVYVDNPELAKKSLEKILAMLRKLNFDVMDGGLNWNTLLEEPQNHKMITYEVAKKKGLLPWFEKSKAKNRGVDAENVDLGSFLDNLASL
uniref:non-specific serine/threonine protein kinase n=1 Tax=Aplanochytrium stocchinoi TaxID=215587 RepID=A0A7S3PM47_9STRA|mmetsp:Transcript_12285/g.15961  ORF Transcript_12285/g.15961 Transcript_12285/m.15961 type:complete len:914 (+) Transcript_12285:466-3207(+)|eukprot:CAMPEP_0204862498 /NCGR_PEP_ID=MMETSP1348-20121228/2565_1 /ASSEMBLY_ACC=CAM_ASM_000700 /TAXON_ID=215587 /ORGANISM="Aplanochytrium stocchinoi, Strain GSBS06" /LENGTH=913 /DNA_ID=CAMNT_0052012467 /DNA_START=388 /DNA_END=3129 /DNA_ORIENTATION=-